MSLVKANTYQDASGGSNAVFSGVASPPNSMGFRNRIINGAMVIDQRNAGATTTPADFAYITDRWQIRQTTASKFSAGQSSTVPDGFSKSLLITSLSSYTVSSSDIYVVRQQIEGFNTADLGWGTANAQAVTLSFWVRSSLTGTFGGSFLNAANNRNYVFTYAINLANTWEYKTVTISGDTTGTWETGNLRGIQISFGLGVGSTFSGTAGAWAGANYASATGAVSVVGTSGATFYITGVQLEAGTVASPFERRDYGRELMMCQRYYEAIGGASTDNNIRIGALSPNPNSTAQGAMGYRWAVEKRANPTVTATTGTGSFRANYLGTDTTVTPTISASSKLTGDVVINSGLSQGNNVGQFVVMAGAKIELSAEL